MKIKQLIDAHNYQEIENLMSKGLNPLAKPLFQKLSPFEYSLQTRSYSAAFAMFKFIGLNDTIRSLSKYDEGLVFFADISQFVDYLINVILTMAAQNSDVPDIYAICIEYRYEYASIIIGLNTDQSFNSNLREYQEKYPTDYDSVQAIEDLRFNPGDFPYGNKSSKTIFIAISEQEYLSAIENACAAAGQRIGAVYQRADQAPVKLFACDYD